MIRVQWYIKQFILQEKKKNFTITNNSKYHGNMGS